MKREIVAPTCKLEDGPGGGKTERYEHDAFGVISMGVVHGGNSNLFGSDLKHNDKIRITISRAVLVRDLANDWIHDRNMLIEIELSQSQFAQFITSPNRGVGVPCTLRSTAPKDAGIEWMPEIKPVESKMEMFRREIKEMAQTRLERMRYAIRRLGNAIEGERLSKKDLREIHRDLSLNADHLPGTLSFVVEQAEEALEKAQAAAKADIEAYVDQTARRLGLEKISDLKQLTNKEK